MEALARRPPIPAGQTALRAGDIEVDRLGRRVTRAGRALDLTASEFKILEVLLLNAGHPVTRSMLLEAVFGLDHPNPAAIIEPHVSRLRAKLQDDDLPDPVRTVRGAGYCINAA